MSSSLYNEFYNNNRTTNLNPMGNFISQLNQFKSTFSGNPETQVKSLLQSGRMSQSQFNQLAQTATYLRSFFK